LGSCGEAGVPSIAAAFVFLDISAPDLNLPLQPGSSLVSAPGGVGDSMGVFSRVNQKMSPDIGRYAFAFSGKGPV
jgi:hypothetical protein